MKEGADVSTVQVEYERGVEAIGDDTSGIAAATALAASSDLVVAVLGDSADSCDEARDRMELDIPGKQLDLLQGLVKTGKPVVLILIHGRPLTFGEGHNSKFGNDNSILNSPNLAILTVGRPGQAGGDAVFDMISGNGPAPGDVDAMAPSSPGGRLNRPWPRGVGYVQSRTSPW